MQTLPIGQLVIKSTAHHFIGHFFGKLGNEFFRGLNEIVALLNESESFRELILIRHQGTKIQSRCTC